MKKNNLHAMRMAAVLFSMVTAPALAEIRVDATAPANQHPTLLVTANGIPQINIQTPSAGGVSRNTYSAFNIEQQGAILNNSRTNTTTQLGGMVSANPWLANGSARVILNEVNSSHPSLLQGYLEVAGARAQVIVANPSGITCDGCGFINAHRATLTTGSVLLNQGNLDSYRVEQGTVTITGNGLDASSADYTDILARAVEVHAGIWANQLTVTTGVQAINADDPTQTTALTNTAVNTPAPEFAIDVAQLGGMYAGHITLIGTEHGVGVRNAGDISSTHYGMVVTADGRLENAGYTRKVASWKIT